MSKTIKIWAVAGGVRENVGPPLPCFDSRSQWVGWHEEKLRAQETPAAHPCTDCTPAYQREMRREGRCEFAEFVRFERDSDGIFVGLLPDEYLEPGSHKDGRKNVLVRAIQGETDDA